VSKIVALGNTVVPALLLLERLGFEVLVVQREHEMTCRARRGDDEYQADDPVTVLGLVKLVEERGWQWNPSDQEIEAVMRRYELESPLEGA
jgi:hypothetical protein